jgi:hypothetical protein
VKLLGTFVNQYVIGRFQHRTRARRHDAATAHTGYFPDRGWFVGETSGLIDALPQRVRSLLEASDTT